MEALKTNASIPQMSIVMLSHPEPVAGWPGGTTVPLQFPIKVKNDKKSANWISTDICSYEPMIVWGGATARTLSLEVIYVVTSKNGTWTVKKIAECCHTLKAYFYRALAAKDVSENAPLINLQIGEIVPRGCTWRMNSVSIAYSDEMMNPGSGKEFPLVTTISMDVSIVTTNIINKKAKQPMQVIKNAAKMKKDWY